MYKTQPIIALDWPPKVGNDFFGRLALIEKNKDSIRSTRSQSSWYQLQGEVDKIVELPENNEITIEDVLKPSDDFSPLRVVIDGPPGIGKTTLCRKILNMWSNGEFQWYNLVLYCPLRSKKIAAATELADLFECKSSKVSKVVDWMSQKDGAGLLFIFDGWDELGSQLRESSLAASIICREQLDQCSVIVTSRSYASSLLLENPFLSRHLQVIGFSKDEISTVVIKTIQKNPILAQQLIRANKVGLRPASILSNHHSFLAMKLVDDLHVRVDVQSLCYIPL